MDTLCLFVKSNHHCLPAFYSYSNNSEHSIIFFSANSYATVVACIFPTTKHNTCLLSSLCDSHGLFPCLLELFCGEDCLKHIQLHNLDLPASFSYSAEVSFYRPQNYQQLFGMIVLHHWLVWPLFQGHLLVIGRIDPSFVHISEAYLLLASFYSILWLASASNNWKYSYRIHHSLQVSYNILPRIQTNMLEMIEKMKLNLLQEFSLAYFILFRVAIWLFQLNHSLLDRIRTIYIG